MKFKGHNYIFDKEISAAQTEFNLLYEKFLVDAHLLIGRHGGSKFFEVLNGKDQTEVDLRLVYCGSSICDLKHHSEFNNTHRSNKIKIILG